MPSLVTVISLCFLTKKGLLGGRNRRRGWRVSQGDIPNFFLANLDVRHRHDPVVVLATDLEIPAQFDGGGDASRDFQIIGAARGTISWVVSSPWVPAATGLAISDESLAIDRGAKAGHGLAITIFQHDRLFAVVGQREVHDQVVIALLVMGDGRLQAGVIASRRGLLKREGLLSLATRSAATGGECEESDGDEREGEVAHKHSLLIGALHTL